jgi:hypothetical protein
VLKYLPLVVLGLTCCLPLSRADHDPTTISHWPIERPDVVLPRHPGTLLPDVVLPRHVEMKGQLIWNNRPERCRVPEFSMYVGGKYYGLDFGPKALREQAIKLAGRNVVLTGSMLEQVGEKWVTVETIRADDLLRKTVKVEAGGYLECEVVGFARDCTGQRGLHPIYGFKLYAGGETFRLAFTSDTLRSVAETCGSGRVRVTGTAQGDQLVVESLRYEADGDIRIIPS